MELTRRTHRYGGPLGQIHNRMSDLFGRFIEDWPMPVVAPGAVGVLMDVTETDDAFHVRAELPGVNIDNVEITVRHNTLTITGEKAESETESDKDHQLAECRYGSFSRAIQLPASVDSEKVEANYADGVLTVTLPKADRSAIKRIEIKK